MRIHYKAFLTIFLGVWVALTCCQCDNKKQREESDRLLTTASKQKNYNQLLQIADSLEASGSISQAKASYWRGYAYDRMKETAKAEDYLRQAMEGTATSKDEEDLEVYEMAASRLANLLCLGGDYEGTLKIAQPAVKRLEELKRDTTSDYVNLLIYIGLCQVSTGASEEDAESAFFLAREKHQQNIERNRCDATYKDAIAGLVNIAYYCVKVGKYHAALYYTSSFGELLGEYEQRPGVDAAYIDRQVGRYTIYKAQALDKLGRKKEAASTYEAFLATSFSKSPEGIHLAEEYQNSLQK